MPCARRRHAVADFHAVGGRARARPLVAGFDAEHVEARGAVGGARHALAPAGLERRLRQQAHWDSRPARSPRDESSGITSIDEFRRRRARGRGGAAAVRAVPADVVGAGRRGFARQLPLEQAADA